MAAPKQYTFTKAQLSKAFSQWLKDYDENPEKFNEYPEATEDGLKEYGKNCSRVLLEYLGLE